MKIQIFSTNRLQTNCFLVENKGKCIIVDPCVKYKDIFKDLNLNLEAVIITHAHFDHIDELESYLNKGLEFYMHKNAYPKLCDSKLNFSKITGNPVTFNLENEKVFFVENDKLKLIDKDIDFIYLPGHSNCSIALMVDEHLFIGDVLFRGSIGRYDLPTASYNEMMNSLSILKSLKKDYIVYPGHGPKTSLFYEINNNPYLKQ